jgi:hypothetical protein
VVAAGRFEINVDHVVTPVFGTSGLLARRVGAGLYWLHWNDFTDGRHYVVKGAPLCDLKLPPHAFEVVDERSFNEDPKIAELMKAEPGILLRLSLSAAPPGVGVAEIAPAETDPLGFEVEISDYTGIA